MRPIGWSIRPVLFIAVAALAIALAWNALLQGYRAIDDSSDGSIITALV